MTIRYIAAKLSPETNIKKISINSNAPDSYPPIPVSVGVMPPVAMVVMDMFTESNNDRSVK